MEEERLETQPIELNEESMAQSSQAPLEEKVIQETPSEKEQIETPINESEAKETESVTEMPASETKEELPIKTAPPPSSPFSLISSLLQKAREKIRLKREKRFEKILELAKKKGEITNDDVEKLLHISDATATRYLSQLVKEGKLLRVGPPERAKYKIP